MGSRQVEGVQLVRRTVVVVAAVIAAVLVVSGAAWLAGGGDSGAPDAAAKTPRPTATASTTPSVTTTSAPATESASPATSSAPAAPAAAKKPVCGSPDHVFRPRAITVPGITSDAVVMAPPREADGVPGTPPLSSAGKTMFAWDVQQDVWPGSDAGNVLLNAHTWPDGTALGNHLLAGLHQGDRIVVKGTTARLCYRVTERVEVLATDGLPRYYDTDGPPQLAIVVCSGRRLGPGDWEKRTVWFASPSV